MLEATQISATEVILQKNLKDMVNLQNPLVEYTKRPVTLMKTIEQKPFTVSLFLGFPLAFSAFTM